MFRVYVGSRLDADGLRIISNDLHACRSVEVIEVVGMTVAGVEDAATLLGMAWSLRDLGS